MNDPSIARPHHTDRAGNRARRLRNEMPMSEAVLWGFLRKHRLGVRFRRQVPIGRWIVDFACLAPRLVIEVDGPSHDDRDESTRTADIRSAGFTLVRVTNEALAADPDRVVERIRDAIAELIHGEA